jgi:hypothetical protein
LLPDLSRPDVSASPGRGFLESNKEAKKKMKKPALAVAAIAMALVVGLAAGSARAADLYSSGAKTWDTSTANWGTSSGGPYDAAAWNNATPDSAMFEGTPGRARPGRGLARRGGRGGFEPKSGRRCGHRGHRGHREKGLRNFDPEPSGRMSPLNMKELFLLAAIPASGIRYPASGIFDF